MADRSEIATRTGLRREGRAKTLGIPKPLKAIRLKCLDCTNHQVQEIRDCTITTCALWPYRMGKYPKAAVTVNTHVTTVTNDAPSPSPTKGEPTS